MTAVAERGRADLEALERLDDAEDVALLVALSDRFSFAPVLVDDAPSARSSKSRTRKRERSSRVRVSRVLLPGRRLPRLRFPRRHMPRMRMPRLHAPTMRRRSRVRRYPIDPIFLEGPRRVPVEVLDLTPSVAADLRLRTHAHAR